MKQVVIWADVHDLSHIEKIKQAIILPVFLMGNSSEWLQELNESGIPSYSGNMSIEWIGKRLEIYSPLILISNEEEKNNLISLLPEVAIKEISTWEERNSPDEEPFLEKMQPLRDVIIRLLGPGGCEYDRRQTHLSLRRNLIEESYEVIEAIEKNDKELLKEELGDLLLQIIFHAQLAEEEGFFKLEDVVTEIAEKLIRRHPHVFDEKMKSIEYGAALDNWEKLKMQEVGKKDRKILEGIPMGLPALLEALKMQEKAHKVGFDWKEVCEVVEKLREEEQEFWEAETEEEKEWEFGDLLFVIVNLGRFFSIDPEIALRKANQRFFNRFDFVETQVNQGFRDWSKYSIRELEGFWKLAKEKEKLKN